MTGIPFHTFTGVPLGFKYPVTSGMLGIPEGMAEATASAVEARFCTPEIGLDSSPQARLAETSIETNAYLEMFDIALSPFEADIIPVSICDGKGQKVPSGPAVLVPVSSWNRF